MQIQDHKLVGVKYDPAATIGNVIDPVLIVNHFTSGYSADGAISTFKSGVVAAHVVIDRDGTITQMVPFNRRANHAGPSAWMGYNMLNNYSIGIELVNLGGATVAANGDLIDEYGRKVKDPSRWVEGFQKNAGPSVKFWETYPEAQINALVEVTKAILATYNIKDITGHEFVDTRGWKSDPGPAFPWPTIRALFRPAQQDDQPHPMTGQTGTTLTGLNVRGGPGTDFSIFRTLPQGTEVTIADHTNGWFKISAPETGYVSDKYVKMG